jgi:hypothetical protein
MKIFACNQLIHVSTEKESTFLSFWPVAGQLKKCFRNFQSIESINRKLKFGQKAVTI